MTQVATTQPRYTVPQAVAHAIDRAKERALDDTLAAVRGMSTRSMRPFRWEQPSLSPEEVRRAARLQERSVQTRFVDLEFDPSDRPMLLASFKVTPPKGEDLLESANHVTLESSTGTWTDVQTETSYTLSLAGTVYHAEPEVEGRAGHVKVAYPVPLFEPGAASQVLSCIAGNILAMKAVDRIKLMDFQMPEVMVRAYPGPRFGVPGIREITNVRGHTLIGTIVKPKTGLFAHEYAEVLYRTLKYACVVKDDENLTDQPFNPFHLRTYLCYQKIAQVESELAERGVFERKLYLPNVTSADAVESLWRMYYVHRLGARGCMVDIMTAGFETVSMLRNWGPPLIIHGHRAMHAGFARVPDHGVDMMVIAKLSRLVGVDELHIGTVVGKMEGEAREVLNLHAALREANYLPISLDDEAYNWYLPQRWYGLRPTMTVNSGGLNPKHLVKLAELFGTDTITTMGGGIHAYGTEDGAWAARLLAMAAARGWDAQYVFDRYGEVVEALQFPYRKPEAEAKAILDRVIKGKDWKALAFTRDTKGA